MFRVRLIAGALVSASLAGAVAAGPNQAHGLVRGTVVAAPTCPGPALRDRKGCAPRPFQTEIRVFATTGRGRDMKDDKPVTTVSTDREGRFQVTLVPGNYRLVPASFGGSSTGKPRDVTVTAGTTTTVGLVVDTGLR